MGHTGIDSEMKIILHADKVRMSLNTYKTINAEELSSFTFDDAMAFVGADYAVAA